MSRRRPTYNLRRVSTWLLTGGLLFFAFFATQRTSSLQDEQRRVDQERARDELESRVQLWEQFVTGALRGQLAEMAEPGAPRDRERQHRASIPWVDAHYLWRAEGGEPRVEWPPPVGEEDFERLIAEPCLQAAQRFRTTGRLEEAAERFGDCVDGPPAARALAAWTSASLYHGLGRHLDGLRVLGELAPRGTLDDLGAQGVALGRALSLRTLELSLREAAGDAAALRSGSEALVTEIAELASPGLAVALTEAESALQQLDDPAQRALRPRLERARRRLVAGTEVRERLADAVHHRPPEDPLSIEIIHDTYSTPGFLLVWARLPNGAFAAVQVDAETLLGAFQDSLSPGPGARYIVMDHTGLVVARDGVRAPLPADRELLASVPFGRLLPELRFAATRLPSDRVVGVPELVLVQVAPVLVGLGLAIVSLFAHVAAERRERALLERQESFIARVTHELKTPLAGIRLMAETLEMGAAEDPATRARFLGRILQESENLGARIDEVLAAARTPRVDALSRVTADALVEPVVQRWRPRYHQAGASLEVHLEPTPEVEVDLALMGDAVSNLLDNALKYRKPGARGHVVIRTGAGGRWVFIEVSDDGIGVPREMRKRIFERFTRVEGAGRGKSGGHGLGLAFVAEAVALHGGLVDCTEGLEGGARFRLRLRRV
jgi:signal transduction histidine kinase